MPITTFSGTDVSSDSPDYTGMPDIRSDEVTLPSVGPVSVWGNNSPTEASSRPVHGDHHQPLPTHAQHYQPSQVHGAHQQAQPMHGAHQQAQPMHGAHHQAQPMHGAHHQPLAHQARHLNNVQNGCRPSCLTMVISSCALITVVTVALLVIYLNSIATQHVSANSTSTSNITLVASGKPIPGQTLQVVGTHFTPGQTVLVTLDGRAVDNSGATAYTSTQSLSLVSLSSANSSGTPVTVQTDGTFTITVHIDIHWAAGSTHHLSVDNQQGKELKSLDLTVEADQSTPTSTTTPTPTSTPPTPTQPTPTPPTPTPVQRTLTSPQQTQSQTVNATGEGTTAGTQATGTIQIVNYGPALDLRAGTSLTNTKGCTAPGLQIILDSNVHLNAYNADRPSPPTPVAIHVVQIGTAGNIKDCPGGRICTSSCNTSTYAFVYCSPTCTSPVTWGAYDINGGFTGGTDPQSYTTVQQSDIDNAAAPLKTSTTQTAETNIQQQLHANEHVVGDPHCTSNVTADHNAGDRASQVTVRVTTTCTATAST